MAQKCDYAVTNEFGRLICTVDESQLCAFQRYCSKASEWQNSKAYSTCERRRNVSKNRNNNTKLESEAIVMTMAIEEVKDINQKTQEAKQVNEIQEPQEKVEEKKPEEKKIKKNESRKVKKRKMEVVRVSLASMTVKDKDGNLYRITGKPTAQVGDIIEL